MKKLFKTAVFVLVLVAIIKAVPVVTDYFFPSTYSSVAEKCAEKYGVDKSLVMAIIKAESNFNKDAVSGKGAKGLMQVMDETGQWCAAQMQTDQPDLFDAKTNIETGTFYFSYLLKKYDGNEKNAVAAYNAGHGNVDKWLSDTSCSLNGKNLDNIPFEETEKYVKKVSLYKKIYSYKDKIKNKESIIKR